MVLILGVLFLNLIKIWRYSKSLCSLLSQIIPRMLIRIYGALINVFHQQQPTNIAGIETTILADRF